jgi:ABC-type transport system involved in multi-copper enzyme maturation permease subunit
VLFGPIAPLELAHHAQRLRYRIVIVAYTALLWLALSVNYLITALVSTGQGSVRESALFASSFFFVFTYCQLVAIFLLTPAYVAGAIALEKERHTLEYLLTTDLRTWEIVLGRFAVRLLHVVLVLLAGLPVLVFARWLGGISGEHIAVAYSLSCALAVALCGLSMLMSIFMVRVRDAVLGTYVVALVGMWILPALLSTARLQWSPMLSWLEYVEQPLRAHPIAVLGDVLRAAAGTDLWEVAGPALRNYTLFGVAALLVAGACMRRVYLRQRFGQARGPRQRRFGRRPMQDDPILWREQIGSRPGLLGRIGQLLVAAGCIGLLVATAAFAGVVLWQRSMGFDAQTVDVAVGDLNDLLRGWGTVMASLILMAIALRASTTITGEREVQTLDPLLVTPLEGRELLKGKLLGSFWAVRWPLGVLALSWLLGAVARALSPLAVIVLLIEMVVYGLFAAALGVVCSLRSRGSGWSMAWAAGAMLFAAGGYYFTCIPAMFWVFFFPASPPTVLAISAFQALPFVSGQREPILLILTSAMVVEITLWLLVYLVVTAGLVFYAVHNFDRLVGRAYAPTEKSAGRSRSGVDASQPAREATVA